MKKKMKNTKIRRRNRRSRRKKRRRRENPVGVLVRPVLNLLNQFERINIVMILNLLFYFMQLNVL